MAIHLQTRNRALARNGTRQQLGLELPSLRPVKRLEILFYLYFSAIPVSFCFFPLTKLILIFKLKGGGNLKQEEDPAQN